MWVRARLFDNRCARIPARVLGEHEFPQYVAASGAPHDYLARAAGINADLVESLRIARQGPQRKGRRRPKDRELSARAGSWPGIINLNRNCESHAQKIVIDRVGYWFDPGESLERAVREHRLEGIVAKRAGSAYRSGERRGDWLKWRANRDQEFVIGGYILIGSVVDSLLVGYYVGGDLTYAGSVRAGLPSEFRRVLLPHCEQLQIARCPFVNLPERTEGRWGEGLTAAKVSACRWLYPFLVAHIEFLESTPENRLRHPRFSGTRSDKDACEVVRD